MSTKETLVATLHKSLKEAKNERLMVKNDPDLAKSVKILKQFQVERLKKTHHDFLISPDTQSATNFFLKELYGTKDLGQRDKDLEKIIPMMEKIFPTNALEVITNAIVLDALTETLDNKMAQKLGDNFSEEEYMKAYSEVTSKEERIKQIQLTKSVGEALIGLVNIPFLNTTLKVMRMPAKLSGLQDMHKFLEEGFGIFKNMKNPQNFITQLINRETILLEDIFGEENKETVKKKI